MSTLSHQEIYKDSGRAAVELPLGDALGALVGQLDDTELARRAEKARLRPGYGDLAAALATEQANRIAGTGTGSVALWALGRCATGTFARSRASFSAGFPWLSLLLHAEHRRQIICAHAVAALLA